MKKRRIRASFTVEAAVVGCVLMLTLAGFMQLSIGLYGDCKEKSKETVSASNITPDQVLRIKRIGGSVYEQYKAEHPIQEEAE